jgi:microcystin-dependent protein
MSEPFLGELKLASFDFAPKGWAQCDGQLLTINQNQALFSLLGTTYGGDGRTTFGLPDLKGRVPVHNGPGSQQGEVVGEEAHTVAIGEMPAHTHAVIASRTTADTPVPINGVLGLANNMYAPGDGNLTTLSPQSVTTVGGGQPHENRMPYLVLNWIIALQGIFPSRN